MQIQLNVEEKDYRKTGIYRITNLINGDFYIGSTRTNFYHRYRNYHTNYEAFLRNERRSTHPYLHNAFSKYNIENFSFEIIEIIEDKSVILKKEGELIRNLNPIYNICKIPEKGGCPNLGRKLSKEWKNKIAEKSKKYKHSIETLKVVSFNNKRNTSKVLVTDGNHSFEFSSVKLAADWLDVNSGNLSSYINKNKPVNGYIVKRITSQKKRILVKFGEDAKEFSSFAECDRYLLMWRGYTSTKVLRLEKLLDKYDYSIL